MSGAEIAQEVVGSPAVMTSCLGTEWLKDREDMSYYVLSQESMHDSLGSPLSLEEFKTMLMDFYEANPILSDHTFEMKDIQADGDRAIALANIKWHAMPRDEKAVVKKEGTSEFRLSRSIYGGWDITQANIPGWVFQSKA